MNVSASCHGMQCLVSDKVCGKQSKQINRSKVLRIQVLQIPSAQQMQLSSNNNLPHDQLPAFVSSASMQPDRGKTPMLWLKSYGSMSFGNQLWPNEFVPV